MVSPSNEEWEKGIARLEDNIVSRITGADSGDRRKASRIAVNVPARYRFFSTEQDWHGGTVADMSAVGVRIVTTELLKKLVKRGMQIEIELKLPEKPEPIRTKGAIAWAKPVTSTGTGQEVVECGIAFKNLKEVSGKERMFRFVAEHLCRFAEFNAGGLTVRVAETLEDMKKAFGLIYKQYRKRGYCEEKTSKMHFGHFSLIPGTRVFILERKGELLGTMSLIPDSPAGLPIESLFPEEIDNLRSRGMNLAEVGMLALDTEKFGKKIFSLTNFDKMTALFHLFKMMHNYSAYCSDLTDLVIAMHPKHQDLYKYFWFEPVGPVRSYSGAQGNPALLMHHNLDFAIKEATDRPGWAFFIGKGKKAPKELFDKHFEWSQDSVQKLFSAEPSVWEKAPEDAREYLNETYPEGDEE